MEIQTINPWNVNFKQASLIQKELQEKIKFKALSKKISLVAGADVSYSKHSDQFFAVVVIVKLPNFEIIEIKTAKGKVPFPYVPGFLSFREVPILSKAFEKLKTLPDVILCDGQGIAHPRQLGLACHLGLVLNRPTIGCAKKRLVGDYRMPASQKGSKTILKFKNKKVGLVFRSKTGIKPIFISPGHLIDFDGSQSLSNKMSISLKNHFFFWESFFR